MYVSQLKILIKSPYLNGPKVIAMVSIRVTEIEFHFSSVIL